MRQALVAILIVVLFAVGYVSQSAADDPPKKDGPATNAPTKPPKPAGLTEEVLRRPWDSDEDYTARCRLTKHLPKLELEAEPFEAALKRIAEYSGVAIVPNWTALEAAAIEKDAEVTFSPCDVRADKVIDLLLDVVSAGEVPLGWVIDGGVVVISTKEDLSRKTMRVTYEVSDLLQVNEEELDKQVNRVVKAMMANGQSDPRRDLELAERVVRTIVRESRALVEKQLLDAVIHNVDPESWRREGGNVGSADLVGTQLVVSQTRGAQQAVFDLLEDLRAARKKQPVTGTTRQ